MSNIFVGLFFSFSTNVLFLANMTVVFSHSATPINFSDEPLDTTFSPEPAGSFETLDCAVLF